MFRIGGRHRQLQPNHNVRQQEYVCVGVWLLDLNTTADWDGLSIAIPKDDRRSEQRLRPTCSCDPRFGNIPKLVRLAFEGTPLFIIQKYPKQRDVGIGPLRVP
jgi:hypothetical protein